MSDRDRSEADLETLVGELRDTLDELQGTVEVDRRGPPTPPGPRELLRFTESYTIPTLLSILEASIRALELLQATLRLVDGRPLDTDRRDRSSDTAARVGSLGRTTVDRVDAALSELTAALEGEPPEGDARDLLTEARTLREEVDERIRRAEAEGRRGRREERVDRGQSSPGGSHEIPVSAEGEPSPEAEDVDAPTVDVDAELASIQDEVEDERERSANWRPDGPSEDEDDPDETATEEARDGTDEDDDGRE